MSKQKTVHDEDEAQSRRFIDLAHELERKGELAPGEDGQVLDRLVRKAAIPRKPQP
jgi:hypothetical protein